MSPAERAVEDPPARAQVVGLGLIGTSLAGALRARGWFVTGDDLLGARAERALELKAVDGLGRDPLAELAVVATPVDAIAGVVRELFATTTQPSLVVTDVGGVKGRVLADLDHPRFVGGHPMAGSEQEGPDGADPELFEGATWVMTPTDRTDPEAFAYVRRVATSLGAEVIALSPSDHDALVAVVSHLPHLVAANLMVLAEEVAQDHAAVLRLAAGGFRDMTRIAAGDPGIWPDIFRDNADAVTTVLDNLIARLLSARELVAGEQRVELVELLDKARDARRNLPARIARPESVVELRIPVADRPGVLAQVTACLGELGVNIFDLEIAHSAEGAAGVLVVTIDRVDLDRARHELHERGFRAAALPPGSP